MSRRLVFIDTETTSLRPDRRPWEIALIVRGSTEDGAGEHRWIIQAEDLDLGNADPMSLRVGRFYERHVEFSGADVDPFGADAPWPERDALEQVERLTRHAHLVGAVPNFDAEVLGARMRAHGICPSWHYHLIDVEALAVGYLVARGQLADPTGGGLNLLPWSSDDLSRALGVTVHDADRHTALGDARWVRDVYDAVIGGADHG